MPHRHSTGPGSPSPRSIPLLSDNTPYSEVDDFPQRTGSTSLSPTKPGPSSESWISKFTHLTTRVPSPTAAKTQKADKKGFLRKRSESFDAHTILSSKRTGFWFEHHPQSNFFILLYSTCTYIDKGLVYWSWYGSLAFSPSLYGTHDHFHQTIHLYPHDKMVMLLSLMSLILRMSCDNSVERLCYILHLC